MDDRMLRAGVLVTIVQQQAVPSNTVSTALLDKSIDTLFMYSNPVDK